MRALNEGARALALWVAIAVDVAEKHPDAAKRQEADDLVALMTPIFKSSSPESCFEVTNLGMQVFGGHGYIREHGMEQLVRDARIAQIYEGANGIQALDLVGRKLGQNMGRLLRRFFHPVGAYVEAGMIQPELAEFVAPLAKSLSRLQQQTLWIAPQGLQEPEGAGGGRGKACCGGS